MGGFGTQRRESPDGWVIRYPPEQVGYGGKGWGSFVDRRLAFVLMTRRAVFAVLAVLSTVGSLALAYAAFGSSNSGFTPTAALIGIFVLLVFPAITVWAWAWDRSVRKRTAARLSRRPGPVLVEHEGGRQPRLLHSDVSSSQDHLSSDVEESV